MTITPQDHKSPARVQRGAGPGAARHRCQQPAPSPEKQQQVPACTMSLRGVVGTEGTDPQWTCGWRSGPRQLLAHIASAFLQLALLPQVSTGDLPLLLPPAADQSSQRTEGPLRRTGMWNQIKNFSLCVCQVHRRGFFSPVILSVLILIISP